MPVPGPGGIRSWGSVVRRVTRNEDFLRKATAPVGLVVVCLIFSIANPRFFTEVNIDGMLGDAVVPIFLTLSAVFVLSIGGIDLSLAATVSLGSVVAAALLRLGVPLLWALVAAVFSGLLVGLVNGLIVGLVRIPDFIVTLGTLSVVSGIALVVSGGNTYQIGVDNRFLVALGNDSVWIFRYDFIVAVVVGLIIQVVLFHTRTGTHLLATGDNAVAASAMGVRLYRIKLFGYGAAGLLAGLGSVMLAAYIGSSQPSVNTEYLLNAIAAVVLGGVSLFGGRAIVWAPMVGAVLLTVLQDGLVLVGFSADYTPIAVGIVVLGSATLMRKG